jgi:hypothetical protein
MLGTVNHILLWYGLDRSWIAAWFDKNGSAPWKEEHLEKESNRHAHPEGQRRGTNDWQ